MHYRLFVTFNKKEAKNAKEARAHVMHELENDPTFVGEGGRFDGPVADWFVIGGRWSGKLQRALLKKDFFEEAKKAVPPSNKGFGWSTRDVEDNKDKFQALWKKLGGKGINPFNRDQYRNLGYRDDAMVVNQKLYDAYLKEYKSKTEGKDKREYEGHEWSELHFVDLDFDQVSKKFIGKKWIVVVDYHN